MYSFSSCGVESGGLFYERKTKLLGHTRAAAFLGAGQNFIERTWIFTDNTTIKYKD